jgi:lactate dehydrogenase-like 2-hydroxyacid dehydrogenase
MKIFFMVKFGARLNSTLPHSLRNQNIHLNLRCLSLATFRVSNSASSKKFKVLFCGKEFPHTLEYAREELHKDFDLFSVDRSEIYDTVSHGSIDVLVPLMCRIDRRIIECGAKNGLKLIHQFGTGLEGVDRLAAADSGVPVLNIPSSDCGNATSCAEHVFWMLLSLLR